MGIKFRLTTLWVIVMIPIVSMLIRFIGIQRTTRLLCPKRSDSLNVSNMNDSKIESSKLEEPKRLLRSLIAAVKSTPFKGNCLSRSMVLKRLLQKHKIRSELLIGVRNRPKFRAHAWVEYQGIPLNAGPRVRENYQIVENLKIANTGDFS